MKRILLVPFFCAVLLGAPALARSQDAVTAAARQETDARLKRLEAELEDMRAANLRQTQQISILENALRKTVNELATSKYASVEDLARLSDALKEIDRKREADKQLVVEKFEEIKRIFAAAPVMPPTPTKPEGNHDKAGKGNSKLIPSGTSAAGDQPGVYHPVLRGQTLLEIIKAYNDELKAKGKPGKITLQQVLDANKGLDPSRMKVGQKLFIPIPQ